MKHFKAITLILLSCIITFYACNNKADANKQATDESLEVLNAITPTEGTTTEPAQNAEGVWHYTCAKGCKGGAGVASLCAACGGNLTHNQAYH